MAYAMNSVAIHSDWVERVIDGKFPLLQWLGGSDAGGVFLTELQGQPWEKAAIKLILADGPDAEAHIAGWKVTLTLSHPNLMHLYHTGRCRIDNTSLIYAVTEYTEEVLAQVLPERPLTPTEAREMLTPVLDVLSYLHGHGMVHGHLKPSNIMVVDDELKLSCDSLHVAGAPARRSVSLSVYDAPETAIAPIAAAADVWSLGVTLVEALTQNRLDWDKHLERDPIVPRSVPQPFAGIAQECLHADPARRCTLSDIRARLKPVPTLEEIPRPAAPSAAPSGVAPAEVAPSPVAARPVLPSPAPPSVARPGETAKAWPSKRRVPALVAAALVLVVVVAALVLRSQHAQTTPPATSSQTAPTSAASLGSAAPAPSVPAPAADAGPPSSPPTPETQTAEGGAEKGTVAERVLPEILPRAQESIRGQVNVTVRVTVDTGGNVSNAELDSPGSSRYFAKQAQDAAQRWKFKPAQVDGQAVGSVWVLQFKFTQAGADVAPVETTP